MTMGSLDLFPLDIDTHVAVSDRFQQSNLGKLERRGELRTKFPRELLLGYRMKICYPVPV
ncbi:MAG: hypothetical protein ACK6DC_20455 [Planctomycetota bacterium]